MIRQILILVLALLFSTGCFAQKFSVNGYVSTIYTGIGDFNKPNYDNGGLVHNRLNFLYLPSDNWEVAMDLRTRAMVGGAYGLSTVTNDLLTRDNGLMNLSWNIVNGNSFLLNTSIDRAYVGYQSEKFSARLGRQRINWSQTMIFNPNDIFNTYSYFDFDYPERAGSDALRLCYYPSGTSTVEFVVKMNRDKQTTAVGFYRGNINGWDLQALGGLYNDENILLGGGFSGTVGGVNLRGELSYYYDTKLTGVEVRNTVLTSLSADYIFPSSLILSAELLYNSMPDSQVGLTGGNIFSAPSSAKQLSVTPFTVSAQATYQFSPILFGGLSAMCYVDMPALYVGPSIDLSAAENFTISAMTQFFVASSSSASLSMCIAYLRVKYNF